MKATPRHDPGQKSGQVLSGSSLEQEVQFRAAGERAPSSRDVRKGDSTADEFPVMPKSCSVKELGNEFVKSHPERKSWTKLRKWLIPGRKLLRRKGNETTVRTWSYSALFLHRHKM